jgi:hypothetical protein
LPLLLALLCATAGWRRGPARQQGGGAVLDAIRRKAVRTVGAFTIGTALRNIPQGDKSRGNADGSRASIMRGRDLGSTLGGSTGAAGSASVAGTASGGGTGSATTS